MHSQMERGGGGATYYGVSAFTLDPAEVGGRYKIRCVRVTNQVGKKIRRRYNLASSCHDGTEEED